jgi:hypothetical protein
MPNNSFDITVARLEFKVSATELIINGAGKPAFEAVFENPCGQNTAHLVAVHESKPAQLKLIRKALLKALTEIEDLA